MANANEPQLVFAAGSPLAATWTELATGKAFTVCNGSEFVAEPSVLLSEFRFAQEQAGSEVPILTDDVLTAELRPNPLLGGKCGDLEVKAKDGAGVSGSFSGFVVLVGPGQGVAKAELQLTDSPPPEAAQVSGASEQATLSAVNDFPWSDGTLEDGGDLLLKQPLRDEGELTVGSTCTKVDEDTSPPATCPFIGNLYNGDQVVHVYVADGPEVDTGVVRLPVRIWPHAQMVGNYEGSLDPAGSGDKEEFVKVKLTGSDSWFAALLAVLIGALLTLGAQWIAQRRRPKVRLERRKRAIAAAYLPNGRPAPVPDHSRLVASESKVGEYLDGETGVQAAIDAYCESVLFLATDSDAYKKIDASLVLAEEDVRMLVDRKKLAAALGELKAAVDMSGKAVGDADVGGTEGTPVLFDLAKVILADGELGVGEATERAKRAKELTEALGTWRKLALRVLRCELWAVAIGARVTGGGGGTPLSPDEQATLRGIWVATRTLRGELYQASGTIDLERLRSSGRIESAFGTLSYLGGKCEVPMPKSREDLDDAKRATGMAELVGAEDARATLGLGRSAADDLELEERQASAAVVAVQGRKLWVASSTLLIDVAILVIGMLPAVVGALAAVYFGKNFGTFDGYLQLIAGGAVGQALVKLIQDNFAIFFHDVRAATGVQPAVVTLPAP